MSNGPAFTCCQMHLTVDAGTATTPQSCTSACQGWRLKGVCPLCSSHALPCLLGDLPESTVCTVTVQFQSLLAGAKALPAGVGVYHMRTHA